MDVSGANSIKDYNQFIRRHEDKFLKLPGIVGLVITMEPLTEKGELVLAVFVDMPKVIPGSIPTEVEGVRVVVHDTGPFVAY